MGTPRREDQNTTVVLVLRGGRYYAGMNRAGHVVSAWSLAGAQHFGPWRQKEIEAAEARCRRANRRPMRAMVVLGGSEYAAP